MDEVNNSVLNDALASNYMLAELEVRNWTATKSDPAAAKWLAKSMGAAPGAAHVATELMLGAKKELKEVQSAFTGIRTFFYQHTLPWTTTTEGAMRGSRLLSVHHSMKFLGEFAKRKAEADAVLAKFVADHYEPAKQRAKVNLGGMWDESRYPTGAQVSRLFGASLNVRPLPAVSDFTRLAIPGKLAAGLQQLYTRHAEVQIGNAMADLQARVLKELSRFIVQMDKVAKGTKTRMFASLVGNPQHLVDLMRSMNLAGNPALLGLADDIQTSILSHKVEDYRDNATLARHAAAEARRLHALAGDDATWGVTEDNKSGLSVTSQEDESQEEILNDAEPDEPGLDQVMAEVEGDLMAGTTHQGGDDTDVDEMLKNLDVDDDMFF